MKKIISFFRDGILEAWIGRFAVALVIIPVIINIIYRTFFSKYSTTIEATALTAYVWLGYSMFGYLYKYDAHVDVKFIVQKLNPKARSIFDLLRDIYICAFSFYMTYWGISLCMGNLYRKVVGTNVPYVYAFASIAIGFFSGAVRSLWSIINRFVKCKNKEENKI